VLHRRFFSKDGLEAMGPAGGFMQLLDGFHAASMQIPGS
jgi:hypothetical protein